MKKLLALVFLSISCYASADAKVYDNLTLTTPSVPVVRIEPRYPDNIKGVSGYVKAEFVITKSGKTSDITVIESVPEGAFDKAAIAALKKWVYKPGELDGKVVKTKHQVTIDFTSRAN